MKPIRCLTAVSLLIYAMLFNPGKAISKPQLHFYKASDERFQYTGRVDFSDKNLPRYWAPGVYVEANFRGTACQVQLNDEELYGKTHNYVSVVIDNRPAQRIKLISKVNILNVADNLPAGNHHITICKTTEAAIGYLEFVGLWCDELLTATKPLSRKIEFIGNSITCGSAADLSTTPCNMGEWYDQHNAYMAYGPVTARQLQARWQLTSVSGIGLVRSCCNMQMVMPNVFDKVNLRDNAILWDFKKYQPDVVTVCLGQNDGIIDSAVFCSAYVQFIKRLRTYYPSAAIICLTSPMADGALLAFQKKQLNSISMFIKRQGEKKVHTYFFTKKYNSGCGGHPDLADHQQIANELSAFIKNVKGW